MYQVVTRKNAQAEQIDEYFYSKEKIILFHIKIIHQKFLVDNFCYRGRVDFFLSPKEMLLPSEHISRST